MATSLKKKAKSLSSVENAQVNFFFADDMRQESSGKVTAVGLYPDGVMVLLVPPGTPDPTKELPYAVDGASFLVNIRNLVGTYKVSIEIAGEHTGSDDAPLPVHEVHFADLRTSVNLIGRLRPLLIASFGIKTATIKIDEVEFKRTFEIRRGPGPLQIETTAVEPLKRVSRAPKKASSKTRVA